MTWDWRPGHPPKPAWHGKHPAGPSRPSQLAAQAIEVIVGLIVGFGIMFPFFKLSNLIIPMRVSREVELQGLDLPEMGALGYPDFELKTQLSYAQTSGESIDLNAKSKH